MRCDIKRCVIGNRLDLPSIHHNFACQGIPRELVIAINAKRRGAEVGVELCDVVEEPNELAVAWSIVMSTIVLTLRSRLGLFVINPLANSSAAVTDLDKKSNTNWYSRRKLGVLA